MFQRERKIPVSGTRRHQALVRAPAEGIVTRMKAKAGDLIAPGKVGMTTVPQQGLQMVMKVSDQDVGRFRVGIAMRIKPDAYDYQKYGVLDGTLRFISPGLEVRQHGGAPHQALNTMKIALGHEIRGQGKYRAQVNLG